MIHRDVFARSSRPLRIAFPPSDGFVDQDEEWCVVEFDGRWRELRLHDYAAIYRVPGLYERLFAGTLECSSPRVVAEALQRAARKRAIPMESLRVLDLGAGNGMVAEELVRRGVDSVFGVDIEPEARAAARRDRPGIYTDYFVRDLGCADSVDREHLHTLELNALVCVAALGFDDVGVPAFLAALEALPSGALVAFNLKEDFLSALDESGFGATLRALVQSSRLRPLRQRRYRHRLSVTGDPIHYVVVTGVIGDGATQ
jgi:SAM-dependent methyltransferase